MESEKGPRPIYFFLFVAIIVFFFVNFIGNQKNGIESQVSSVLYWVLVLISLFLILRELYEATEKNSRSIHALFSIIFTGIIIIILFNHGISMGFRQPVSTPSEIPFLKQTSSTVQSDQNSVSRQISEGYRYYQQKDYSRVSEIADGILAGNPDNREALYLKGLALRMNGASSQSLEYFDHILQVDPAYANAWAQKGWAYQDLGRYQEEADAFENAIRLETNITSTKYSWYGKGQALRNLGKYDEAISAFNRALQLDPNYAECFSQIGIVYSRQGKFDEAIAMMDRTISLKPDYGHGWTDKGWVYEKMGKWDEMLDAFENALRVSGDNRVQAQAWDGKGSAFTHLGRFDEAMSAYDTAIRLNPSRFETYVHKGKLLVSKGDYAGAVTEFEKTLAINPNHADAWWFKAVALENMGDTQGSGTAQTRAVSLDPVKYGSKTLPRNLTPVVTSKPFLFF